MPVRVALPAFLVLLLVQCTGQNSGGSGGSSDPSRIDHFVKTMQESGKTPNRLIHQKSPYLLQHAFNPVGWYPWGEEAFQRARDENKPIFLSIGYSTCHWCHVMEHESFENDSIAALMNEYFVCIKVDREERPDIDKVYMAALQGMGQGGGWPMSMFLTPDLRPFYGGTYFPPEERYGRISFPELLRRIHTVWTTQNEKVLESASGLTEYLRQAADQTDSASLNPGIADLCFKQLEASYDPRNAGFGGGPKFPRPVVFSFLLRYYVRTGSEKALAMTEKTLRKMSEGGIADHLGGGFHRYSVDAEWRVPHFEKMLYDQAQLACSYLELFQVTGNEAYASIAREILGYVRRDLTDKNGGFYSAEDADSPDPSDPSRKMEGAFYLWTEQELRQLLSPEDFLIFSQYYGIQSGGNAPADPQGEFQGKNIPYVSISLDKLSSEIGRDSAELANRLLHIRTRLLEERTKRPRPHLDDKILTSWNGMMISAFARANQTLGDREYLTAAENAARFIVENLYDREEEVLLRRYRDGEGGLEAHLDDYAFLAQGLLDLYEASFDLDWLDWSVRLTQKMVEIFHDREHGGFFDTSGKDPSVLVRTKETYDGAEAAGNSIAVGVLLRVADMTDNDHWRGMAAEALTAVSRFLNQQPSVMPQMVVALDILHHKPKQIILVGKREEEGTERFLSSVHRRLLPGRMLMLVEEEGPDVPAARFLPFAGKLTRVDGKPTAYVCEDYVCQLPTNDGGVFDRLLVMKSGMDN
jgi:uncharacterized protein YyaL (SSP411 family)